MPRSSTCFRFARKPLTLTRFVKNSFCRNPRRTFPNKLVGEFWGKCFGGHFSGLCLWKKTGGNKSHPNIRSKIQIRFGELRGQNPHCKGLPMMLKQTRRRTTTTKQQHNNYRKQQPPKMNNNTPPPQATTTTLLGCSFWMPESERTFPETQAKRCPKHLGRVCLNNSRFVPTGNFP